jgi:uncharacterized protein (TIGR04222 family)
MNLNPLDLPGPAFLAFYAFALIIAHFAGKALMKLCHSSHAESGTPPDDLFPSEIALLAGGRERAVETALVRLLRNDWVAARPGGGFDVTGKPPGALHDLQADVYREISRKNGTIEALRKVKSVFLDRAEAGLAKRGLLLARGSGEAICQRAAKCLPFAAVIVLGAARLAIGISRGRPGAFLALFLLVSLIILGIKFFNLPLRSAQGERTLQQLKRKNAALQTTVRRRIAEVGDGGLLLAVALFGPQVLASSELAWMHESFVMRRQDSSDGGTGGGSCSGGCGGGGCGGCGG